MSIKIKLDGFEEMLKDIEAAGGEMAKATESAVRQSAQIMQTEIKSQMSAVGADSGLINRMPPFEVEKTGNAVYAKVGYKSTAYDEKNPSDYFKAIFLNYGTPHRKKHGIEKARGFIQKAKKTAKPKMKKAQKEALEKILARLKK